MTTDPNPSAVPAPHGDAVREALRNLAGCVAYSTLTMNRTRRVERDEEGKAHPITEYVLTEEFVEGVKPLLEAAATALLSPPQDAQARDAGESERRALEAALRDAIATWQFGESQNHEHSWHDREDWFERHEVARKIRKDIASLRPAGRSEPR
jgi:hypothetical protein